MIPSAKRPDEKIAYIDLFAGPGKYKDGTKSTPLLILEKAINDSDIRNVLVTIFSDSDPANVSSLKNAIFSMPGIYTLKYKPQIRTKIVDENIAEIFQSVNMVPSLTFLDPWGYKGLSCQLINSLIKDWGCDCILFFNYRRINMGINNDKVKAHMDALFGKENADELRKGLSLKSPFEREETILNILSDSLTKLGKRYVLQFRFRDNNDRISHHLILITKHKKGYVIMKDIMAKASSHSEEGVPSFEYSTVKRDQLYLFYPNSPLDKLEEDLTKHFEGQSTSMSELYNTHNLGTHYIRNNYKHVLLRLEEKGEIITDPPISKRRRGTFGDNVSITFPPQGAN